MCSSDLGGAKVPLGPVETFDAGLIEDNLWMRFVVTFAEPVDPRETSFSYAVYDPSYYIEIIYNDPAKANLEAAAPAGCSAQLEEANPTAEQHAPAPTRAIEPTASQLARYQLTDLPRDDFPLEAPSAGFVASASCVSSQALWRSFSSISALAFASASAFALSAADLSMISLSITLRLASAILPSCLRQCHKHQCGAAAPGEQNVLILFSLATVFSKN